MTSKPHSFWFFLRVSMVGAFLTAFAFIAAIYFSLPPTDLAYGHGLLTMLCDPFVLTIASPVAAVSGLLASPLLFFCLRRKRLAIALPIVFVSVLAAVILTTMFSRFGQFAGLGSAYIALIVSVLICTLMPDNLSGHERTIT